jgi:carbohydrate-selective porin OprB
MGTWHLWDKKGNHPGSLGFHTEYRHRDSSITPSDLSENVGSLWKTIRGFNRAEFSLVEIWWEQQILKDVIGFRIGKLNMKDYFNNYKFNSSNKYFFNTAFSDSPAIAFPGNGGGLVLGYRPSKKSYIVAGIADANGKKTSLDNTFVFNASKYFYAVEFGVKPKFNNFGAGTYSLTLWHREKQDEDDLPSDEGFALSLQQEVTEKIIPFVRYSYSDGDSTEIQQLISTGIGFVDTFDREGDVAGIGLAWGDPSDKSLQDQYTMESFYRFQAGKHLQITPGFQLIVNPSNDPDSDVKTVFQIRARITF